MTYIRYEHHGNLVWVCAELKGRHREHCLCWDSGHFTPDNREGNCPRANELYEFDVRQGMVTPVWECPLFSKRGDE